MVIDSDFEVFVVHANCRAIKGANRIAIYDLNGKIFLLDKSNEELVDRVFSRNHVSRKEMSLSSELLSMCNFLEGKKLGIWTHPEIADSLSPINFNYVPPTIITNSVIDIVGEEKYYQKFIIELAELNCPFVQIRFYPTTDLKVVKEIAECIQVNELPSVQFLIPYANIDSFFSEINQLVLQNSRISEIIVYGLPQQLAKPMNGLSQIIKTTTDSFTNSNDCGCIGSQYFIPSVEFFNESLKYNNCLNRKISLTTDGFLKNCPSLPLNYGHITNTSLIDVVHTNEFQFWWHIKKDDIKICNKCEFRYMCSDCRAFTIDSKDIYSKPAKCNYDPIILNKNEQE